MTDNIDMLDMHVLPTTLMQPGGAFGDSKVLTQLRNLLNDAVSNVGYVAVRNNKAEECLCADSIALDELVDYAGSANGAAGIQRPIAFF